MKDALTTRERRIVEQLRDEHEQYGCPSDPKRASFCAKEPCRTLLVVTVIDRLAPKPKPEATATAKRLDDDEGWLYLGVRIVKRFTRGGGQRDAGFWMLDHADSQGERFYTLPDAKKAVRAMKHDMTGVPA